MKAIWLAILLVLCLLPTLACAELVTTDEDSPLPYGLALGMSTENVEALLQSNDALKSYTKEDYGNGVFYYTVSDAPIPDTDLTATSLQVQVDTNNSAKALRLTSVTLDLYGMENGVSTFRALLAALTARFGAPGADPFSDESADIYEEWGSLDASWQTSELRVSLSLSRMYDESVSVQYVSRKNYDKSDLSK